ncbi:MAG: TIR domain-containing protein, partial [Dehalococcoidia bacterium]
MAELSVSPAPHVFLSYASGDRARALALADALEAAGISVWVDRRDIAGGSSWDTAIVDGISHCSVFALACSTASLASPNVQQEVRLAWEEQRPILPLLLEQAPIPRELRYPLAGRQWVEVLERATETWLPDVLRALAGLDMLPVAPEAAAAAEAPAAARAPTNLPASLTSFLGRGQELAEIAKLLANNRLVTLTGPGGTGKTRLALSAASAQMAAFPDGVFFIDLAPLADPTLVPSAVAQALGVQGIPETPIQESVVRFLRDKRLLLVLDNYEHLLAAAAFAGVLLQGAGQVSLLVTSRAPLRVPGEREYAVPPLPVPRETSMSVAEGAENPAVALFVARAQDVRTDFVLTDANAAIVAAICTRLDGLPLAIELAAARVRVLPPAALLSRLTQRLPLLTGGARTAPARQQTLRDTIAWSYDLLEPAEQRLLCRLSVFAGGATLELAVAVCDAGGDLGIDVLDGVSSLVEKSLLRQSDGQTGEPRYRMLETVREFALGALEASGEAKTVHRRFAEQLLQHAEQYQATNDRAQQDAELDNARAALGWCVEQAELALGAGLFWALGIYLYHRGGTKEREAWRQRLLALPEAAQPSIARARLLARSPWGFTPAAKQDQIGAELEEAVALSRQLNDPHCLGNALMNLARLRIQQGNMAAAVALDEEALPLVLAVGDFDNADVARGRLVQASLFRGDIAAAEELVAAGRALAPTAGRAFSLVGEATLAEAHGDDARAHLFWEAAVRRAGADLGEDSPNRLAILARFAEFALRKGDMRAAVACSADSLAVHHRVGPSMPMFLILSVLARVAERCSRFADSV